jgi:hypothetical protein
MTVRGRRWRNVAAMQLPIPVVAITLALGTALTVPRAAVAQLAFPTAGARVRVTAPDFSIRGDTGRLVRATPDSLTIRFATTTPDMTIAVDKFSRLEVSIGKTVVPVWRAGRGSER